jgi:hypothetical protein
MMGWSHAITASLLVQHAFQLFEVDVCGMFTTTFLIATDWMVKYVTTAQVMGKDYALL